MSLSKVCLTPKCKFSVRPNTAQVNELRWYRTARTYTSEQRKVKVYGMHTNTGTLGRLWRRYVRDSRAVSALEYAILVGIIAVAVGLALNTFSGNVQTAIETIGTQVETAGTNAQAVDTNPTD